jgi:hypothetical protein
VNQKIRKGIKMKQWKYNRDEAVIFDSDGKVIATMSPAGTDEDGELMAKAPEMLEALKKIGTFNEVSNMLIAQSMLEEDK